ncbi:hypothetical protein J7E88_33050 [Streptomyces sp. ISL-10]|nr:hypothetical protein [Streptomyces sp. ISL-10]
MVARYLTVAGATVDITQRASEAYTSTPPEKPELMRYYRAHQVVDLTFTAVCQGCRKKDISEYAEIDADRVETFLDEQADRCRNPQGWAQKHAAQCRALPRP